MRERANVLIAYPDVRATLDSDAPPSPVILDPATADSFPEGWVVSDRATLRWSADNGRVFFGIKDQVEKPDTKRLGTDEGTDEGTNEVANVDVWNTSDERIQSV